MSLKPSYSKIKEISPYKPGETSKFNSERSIKLSSNENPFGCSEEVKNAISEEFQKLHRYPDGGAIELRNRIAKKNNLISEKIICGAGSDELITLICMAYCAGEDSEIIYTEHGFLMYPIAAKSVGAKPIKAKENNLVTDVNEILKLANQKTKAVFIANPNNPTGSFISFSDIKKLCDGLPESCILVIDLAYFEYAENLKDYPNPYSLVDDYKNIIILRTFSKAYGIPNLRLGWAYSNEEIIDVLNRVRGPFNVSGVSQVAGIAALEDQQFIEKSVEHNNKWLERFKREFESIGLKSYPSAANFILVDFGELEQVEKVDLYLKESGITGRRMDAYGLPTCMRFSIGLEQENEILLEKLKSLLF